MPYTVLKYDRGARKSPCDIVEEKVQADWLEADDTSPAYIKNKPDITKLETALAGKADKTELESKADKSALAELATKAELESKADKTELAGKADKTELESKADKSALDAKADKTALETTEGALAALEKRVAALEKSGGGS